MAEEPTIYTSYRDFGTKLIQMKHMIFYYLVKSAIFFLLSRWGHISIKSYKNCLFKLKFKVNRYKNFLYTIFSYKVLFNPCPILITKEIFGWNESSWKCFVTISYLFRNWAQLNISSPKINSTVYSTYYEVMWLIEAAFAVLG